MPDAAETWTTLHGENVTQLQRWGSAWADLLAADMALLERRELARQSSTLFQRRALWESSVIAYGRADQSNRKRKIPFRDFVEEVAGEDGLATHERIMDWRHGHVAHRRQAEFESSETVLAYGDGSVTPTALRLVLGIDIGPEDDSAFVTAFQRHVEMLRNAMYERKIGPLAEQVVNDLNSGRVAAPSVPRPADDQSSAERYVINHLLLTLDSRPSL